MTLKKKRKEKKKPLNLFTVLVLIQMRKHDVQLLFVLLKVGDELGHVQIARFAGVGFPEKLFHLILGDVGVTQPFEAFEQLVDVDPAIAVGVQLMEQFFQPMTFGFHSGFLHHPAAGFGGGGSGVDGVDVVGLHFHAQFMVLKKQRLRRLRRRQGHA